MFLGLLSVIGHYVGRIPRKRVPVHWRSVDAGVIKPFTVILWHFNVVSNFGSIGVVWSRSGSRSPLSSPGTAGRSSEKNLEFLEGTADGIDTWSKIVGQVSLQVYEVD